MYLIPLLKNRVIALKENDSLRNGLLFSAFSFINKGFSFILVLILVTFVSPADYGLLNLFGTVVMVIGYVMALSTDNYLSVAYFNDGEIGVKNTVSGVAFITIIVSSILLLSLLLFGDAIASLVQLPLSVLYFAISISFFTVYNYLNLDFFRIKQQLKGYGILSCTNALLNLVVSILLVKTLSMEWQGRVYAQAGCCLFFGMIGIVFFINKGYYKRIDFSYLKAMILWGLPLIPHVATNFLRQGCDRYIINYYHSIEDVGYFSFALNLANIIILVGLSFNQSNSVDIFKILGDSTLQPQDKFKRIYNQNRPIKKIYILSSIVIPIITCLAMPVLLPKYRDCILYIPILSLSSFFNCMYFLYTNFLFFYKRTKYIMYVTFGSSIIHLVLSLIFTRYSLYCTSLIYCFSQLLILVFIRKLSLAVLREHNIINNEEIKKFRY